MNIKQNSKVVAGGVFLACLTVSSCSDEHNQEVVDNINLEFELTYQYVVENMPIDTNYSKDFSTFKRLNKDAFTSIAYTWHSISMSECELAVSSNRQSSGSSYERLTQKSSTNSHLIKTIVDKERICLARIYFDNWSNIQKMLSLSFQISR